MGFVTFIGRKTAYFEYEIIDEHLEQRTSMQILSFWCCMQFGTLWDMFKIQLAVFFLLTRHNLQLCLKDIFCIFQKFWVFGFVCRLAHFGTHLKYSLKYLFVHYNSKTTLISKDVYIFFQILSFWCCM